MCVCEQVRRGGVLVVHVGCGLVWWLSPYQRTMLASTLLKGHTSVRLENMRIITRRCGQRPVPSDRVRRILAQRGPSWRRDQSLQTRAHARLRSRTSSCGFQPHQSASAGACGELGDDRPRLQQRA